MTNDERRQNITAMLADNQHALDLINSLSPLLQAQLDGWKHESIKARLEAELQQIPSIEA